MKNKQKKKQQLCVRHNSSVYIARCSQLMQKKSLARHHGGDSNLPLEMGNKRRRQQTSAASDKRLKTSRNNRNYTNQTFQNVVFFNWGFNSGDDSCGYSTQKNGKDGS
ncbi:hypothetical protein OUZ56_024997 [Daphnia magna]|uniref:Uncharacterized protein n=1 Tax=Daphnia magna TaxID=35525 RepID=A0ABQ9ZIM5_9CRUS|nr:hypothetical protein OUZ56_024997 [Daphnia magna]